MFDPEVGNFFFVCFCEMNMKMTRIKNEIDQE